MPDPGKTDSYNDGVPEQYDQLTRGARLFYVQVVLLGGLVLVSALFEPVYAREHWLNLFFLTLALLPLHLIPTSYDVHYTTRPIIPIIIAGVLVLPSPMLEILVLLAVTISAWQCKRSLYHRVFDAATLLIAARAASMIMAVPPFAPALADTPVVTLGRSLAMMVFFILIARFLLRHLATSTMAATRLLPFPLFDQTLISDLALATMGVFYGVLWLSDPWMAPIALLPMIVLSQALAPRPLVDPDLLDGSVLGSSTATAAFESRANTYIRKAIKEGKPVTVILADVDHLRQVNRVHGHVTGNFYLEQVERVINLLLDEEALYWRFGGEDYCVIAAGYDAVKGLELAELIRERVEIEQVASQSGAGSVSTTLSLGVAVGPLHDGNLRSLLAAADAAMRRSKMSGRNRTTLAMVDRQLAARPQEPDDATKADEARLRKEIAAAINVGDQAEQQRMARRRHALGFAFAVAATLLALAIAYLTFRVSPMVTPVIDLFLMVAIVILSEAFAVYDRSGRRITPSFMVGLTVVFTYGISAALLIAPALTAYRALAFKDDRWRRTLLEFAGVLTCYSLVAFLSMEIQHGVTGLLPREFGQVAIRTGLAGIIAQWTILTLGNSIAEWTSPSSLWVRRYRWQAPHYLFSIVFAYIFAWFLPTNKFLVLIGFVLFTLLMRFVVGRQIMESEEQVQELTRANQLLRASYENSLLTLVNALDARDHETLGHSERVANLTVATGEEIGLRGEELANLRLGALLHDIGKISIPDAILHKPGKLNDEEWSVMREHPRAGYNIIQGIDFLNQSAQVVVCHHERWDGNGYPLGLKGEQIPIQARIFAVADTYDAITSDRPYRKGQSKEVALAEIWRNSGTQFDPEVVAAFERVLNRTEQDEQAAYEDAALMANVELGQAKPSLAHQFRGLSGDTSPSN